VSVADSQPSQPFDRRTLLALIASGALAFLVMSYFMAVGEHGRTTASASTTSRSAVGYRAFVELLRHYDMSVVPPSAAALADGSLRVLLAPKVSPELREALRSRLPVLIVLPKWQAFARPFSDRVSEVQPVSLSDAEVIARAVAAQARIVRPEAVHGWHDEAGVQGVPVLSHPQLVRSPDLCPVVSSDEGMLVGRLCRQPSIVVLADPDLIANHGLWRGDNAALVLNLVTRLRTNNGPVVALEPLAQAAPGRSIWLLAISPPFVLITLAAAIATGIALWCAAVRFGPAMAAREPSRAGVLDLIEVAARLVSEKGEPVRLLRRYSDLLVLDLGRRLHAPTGLEGVPAVGGWLDSRRRIAGGTTSYGELAREIDRLYFRGRGDTVAALATAARLCRWHKEFLNGR
jgi:hypothetical protein